MASLPVPEQLGRRSFQDRSQVVTPRYDPTALDIVAQTASDIMERRDQASLRKAKLQFQKLKLEADAAFETDTDFETYQERYDAMLSKAAESSSGLIRNNRLKEAFKEEISLYQTEGSLAIRNKALKKEIDHGIADLNESLTVGRENYLRATTPEDRAFAREGMLEAIEFAESSSYIDADKAQALRQSAALDLAIASVKVEPPSKQIKLLKENKGLIDVIPLDTRLKMIEEASDKGRQEVALAAANSIRANGGDRAARLMEADKITDIETRELVRQQVEVDLGREHRALVDQQYKAYDDLKKKVIEGKSSIEVSTENPDAWNAMSADQQAAIRAMDGKKAKTSNLVVYDTLNRLAARDQTEAYTYFAQNAHKLSDADAKKWSDRLSSDTELTGYLSRSQRLSVAMSKIGINDKKSSNYKLAEEQLDADYQTFQKDKGRAPDAEELDKLIGGVTKKVVDTSWFNPFTSDKYGFDLTPEQRKEVKESGKLDRFNQLLGQYESRLADENNGVPVILSDDKINALYQAWDQKGYLDATD